MKKLFTLAAAGVLAATSLSAQAQVTLDGVLSAAEIATGTTTTTGNYVLIGKFTNPRGFGDAGLLSLYAASSATKVYLFLGGTVEQNGNAFQLYLNVPAAPAGVPRGTALPAGASGTSFQNVTAKMELPVNLALALRSDAAVGTTTTYTYRVEAAAYASATSVTSARLNDNMTAATTFTGNGTAFTLPANTSFPRLSGARVAYRGTADGKLVGTSTTAPSNPGAISPNTAAGYGAAGSYGWEIELDRTATGLTGTGTALSIFAIQNGGDGGYMSSDFIPQTSAPLTTNSGNLATGAFDFSTLPGLQAATINVAVTGGTTLGTKAAEAAVALGVYPNPVAGSATVSYEVATSATPVRIALTDLLGRTVRVLEDGVKSAGAQTKNVSTADLTAGTYLLRVQVGDNVATRKVVVL